MKKIYSVLCLAFAMGVSVHTTAQTNPGTANLTHQWTFDDGTAKDKVGTADGTLQGAATIANKSLVTSAGGYMSFPATDIMLSSYSEASVEIWYTSSAGVNTGFTMLSFFGNTTGTVGTDYFSLSTARGDNFSRAAISCLDAATPWVSETGVNTTEYDDGKLHHMVGTLNATGITLYVDGLNVGTAPYSRAENMISNIGNQFVYLAKGGYTGDPTWKGAIHKFSIYKKALTDDEVLYNFQKGAEELPVITTTTTAITLDDNYPAETFSVTGANLSAPITITSPAGILIQNSAGKTITSLPATAVAEPITAIISTAVPVDGNITLTSGSTVVTIPVKSVSDAACFVPLYKDLTNLITQPGFNTLASYAGWGSRDVVTVLSDPANVYCGAASMKIGNGTTTGSGSLDVLLGGVLQPNTTYHVKVMIKTMDGTFHLGVDAAPNVEVALNTNGEWKPLEFTFTTGAVLGANPVMYINNWACTGTVAYVDNYELYVAPDAIIVPSKSTLSFDADTKKTVDFTVTSSNLSADITLDAPVGITLSKSTLPAASAGDSVIVTYDGVSAINGNITMTSGNTVVNIPVKALTTSSSTCFTPLYTDRQNLCVDPYMNDFNGFGGWGAKSIVYNVDSAYCGSRCGMINGSGSIDVQLTGKLIPNTVYIAKAMVKSFGKFQMGVYGQGAPEFTDSIVTNGTWKPFVFEFTTGETLGATSGLYFNNWSLSGTRGYIDNWEVYRKDTVNAVVDLKFKTNNFYVQNGKIVAEFENRSESDAKLSVYTVQGTLVSEEQFACTSGRNKRTVSAVLPKGMYMVQLTQAGQTSHAKLIKR